MLQYIGIFKDLKSLHPAEERKEAVRLSKIRARGIRAHYDISRNDLAKSPLK